MKVLQNFINEKLKINSKSKVENNVSRIAKALDIEEKYAKEIADKYMDMKYFTTLEPEFEKDLYATQFELVFMLASMLVGDNQDIEAILDLGYKSYKIKLKGHYNPYDYSWFEEEFSDQDNDYATILDYIQEQYNHNEEFKKLFKEVYEFCKKANINDPDKMFDFYTQIDN